MDKIIAGIGGIVAAAIVENPVAIAVIGVAAVGYCAYRAVDALVDAAAPLVQQAADTVSDAYSAAVDEVGRLINGAPHTIDEFGFTQSAPGALVIAIRDTGR